VTEAEHPASAGGEAVRSATFPGSGTPSPAATAAGDLVRSSAVVGVGTALSRVTGLVRVGALTYALGATALSDAYNLANTTPLIVYELLLGGVLSATLVPLFVEHRERGDDEATSAVVTVATAALVVLTAIAVAASPLLVHVYTVRLDERAADAQAAVMLPLLRLFLLQILFFGVTALATALLNSRRRFGPPAFAPVLNNLVVSAALLAVPTLAGHRPALGDVRGDAGLLAVLGLGATGGVAAMAVVNVWAVRRAGVQLRWRPQLRHPAVRAVAGLSGWTLGYVAANQACLFLVLALANERPGDVSAYQYAFVFFQLPHGLFAVSIMTTVAPDLAAFAARADWDGMRRRFSLGLRLLALVVLPAAAGYALLARPIVSALLERGALSGASAARTAEVLALFSLGLLGFSAYLYVLRGFYALKDTRTPFLLNVLENGVNMVLAVALVHRFQVQGLAVAYAGAYTIAAVVAWAVLRRRLGGLDGRRTATSLARIGAATGVMAAAVWVVARSVGGDTGGPAVVRMAAGVVTGAAVYGAGLFVLRVDEVRSVADLVASRTRRRRGLP
jgi:putative peptidoglycan lipid II flippase